MSRHPGCRLHAACLAALVLAPGAAVAEEEVVLYRGVDPDSMTPRYDATLQPLPHNAGGNLRQHDTPYRTETFEAIVPPRNQVEFMADMARGEVLLFEWEAASPLYYDLHAHAEQGHPDFLSRYAEGKARTGHGSLVAPYTGEHGWLWLNLGSEPVTLRLKVTGSYLRMKKLD